MTANRFGGFWTKDKLQVLRDYLGFFTTAMSRQRFQLVYIDAFAGTGRCHIKGGPKGSHTIDGSAKIALDCTPAFDQYRFIEKKKVHQDELKTLLATHPNGHKATLGSDSAEELLPRVLSQDFDWNHTRGVLFLDPFGLQCSYQLLQQIAATRALDVFFLVSLSGLYRQAAVDARNIDDGKAAKLTKFLGTDGWRTHLYTNEQHDLFGEPEVTRAPGWQDILNFTTERLRTVFPYVSPPNMMGFANNAPLFALYFAVSNPDGKAVGLAKKVSKEILAKLPKA